MITPSSARSVWPSSTIRLLVSLCATVLLLSSCAESAEPLPAEVATQLDIANNAIADLTADGGDDVPANELRQAVLRAQEAGTTLRIVVAAPDGEFVSAKSIVDRYGGTAISYQSERSAFEGASRDMSADQLDRAVDAAKVEFDIGESAAAFVRVLETEGLDERGRSWTGTGNTGWGRWVIYAVLLATAVFMLSGAWSYLQARKRRIKRRRQFIERRAVLTDWAAQLGPEVEALRTDVASSSDTEAQRIWHESEEFVGSIATSLAGATTVGELDAAEMRIGRAAIKLRDLRVSLNPS